MPSVYRPQARNWCFTLNNPGPQSAGRLLDGSLKLVYAVWQLETGKNGTPHLQGYLAFKERMRLSQLTKILHGAHFEIARGSPAQNQAYCTKEETRIGEKIEIGDFSQINTQGNRSDLEELQSAFDAGLTEEEYATDYFNHWIRYPKALTSYKHAKIRARTQTQKVHVTLLIGQTGGTGKSWYAETLARQLGLGEFFRCDLGEWFDGYVGQRILILEDFRGSSLPFTLFKRLCDRNSLRVGVKGSSCEMAATHIFITSNFAPENWWDQKVTGTDLSPIYRRINRVLYFSEFLKYYDYPDWRSCAIDWFTPQLHNANIQTPPNYVPQIQEELDQEELLDETSSVSSGTSDVPWPSTPTLPWNAENKDC